MDQTIKKEDSLRLLLATTNPELQGQIEQLLQAEDVEIFRATGTGEVFNKMSRCQPHLILNDLDMPDVQVRELLTESKRQGFFIPVIFLSASDSVQKAVEAMREGAYDYVKIPFNPEDLLIRIRKALDNQRIRNEKQNLQMELRYRRNSDYIIGTNTKILKVLGQILLPIQAKFLRILDKGEFRKVGGTETTHVDVRVIAATKKNLTQAIE